MSIENATMVDACQAILHGRGWSSGDMAFNDGHAVVWQVFARRADQRIVVRAPTQADAWAATVEQSRGIGQM